jgi:predicted MFS family arabinose efflux permease
MLFLTLAVLGCVGFSQAQGFTLLLLSRVLIGIGVCACLMAPMAAYRRWFSPEGQLRSNSWMLMTGAFGMLSSTLPVQWFLPLIGWRGIFLALGALFALCIAMILFLIPHENAPQNQADTAKSMEQEGAQTGGLATVFFHPYFIAVAPLAFLFYGGYSAMQTLWIGPWLTKVVGLEAHAAAQGLFLLNVVMLFVFLLWGLLVPKLNAWGWSANRVIVYCLPMGLVVLLGMVLFPSQAHWYAWAAYLAFSSALSLAQPSLAMYFDASLAGRALTLFNLMIFSGSFFVQWFFGLGVDVLQRFGYESQHAFQGSLLIFTLLCAFSYIWFVWRLK